MRLFLLLRGHEIRVHHGTDKIKAELDALQSACATPGENLSSSVFFRLDPTHQILPPERWAVGVDGHVEVGRRG